MTSPQLTVFDSVEEAVAAYFRLGYSYKDIVTMMQAYHGIEMSTRTLKRKLARLGLRRHNIAEDDLAVTRAIQRELQENGNSRGYRMVTHAIRLQGVSCTRLQVQRILSELDPVATDCRRSHRLVRRLYSSPGPCHLWHMDGFDKMKPFGFPIHGAIDGYSRKILWLKTCYSNNDPSIIAHHYHEAICEWQTPRLLRTDHGSENTIAAGMQAYIYNDETAHLFGKSTSNQRIEALWSKLRPTLQPWMDFLKNFIEPGNSVMISCARFCFTKLVQKTLDDFKLYWNNHSVRQTADCPAGKPDVLFFDPSSDQRGLSVPEHVLLELGEWCQGANSVTGDPFEDEYFEYVTQRLNLDPIPTCKADGLMLYTQLIAAARDQ